MNIFEIFKGGREEKQQELTPEEKRLSEMSPEDLKAKRDEALDELSNSINEALPNDDTEAAAEEEKKENIA